MAANPRSRQSPSRNSSAPGRAPGRSTRSRRGRARPTSAATSPGSSRSQNGWARTAAPPASWMISIASGASASAARRRPSLRARATPRRRRSSPLASRRRPWRCGPADRRGVPRLGDRILETHRDALGIEALDDLLGAGHPLGRWARSQAGAIPWSCPPSTRACACHRGVRAHTRSRSRAPVRLQPPSRLRGLRNTIDRVVVGEGERRHSRLRRRGDHLRGRQLAVGVRGMALQVHHRRRRI